MRAFLAIDPDTATLFTLRGYMKQLQKSPWAKRVRWVDDENFHLTLRFLGQISEAQKDEFIASLTANLPRLGDVANMTVTLTEPRLFPKPSHPRVIACIVEPNTALSQLARVAESCAIAIGLEPERRPFSGHITLGRTKESFPRSVLLPAAESLRMRVKTIALYKSDLTARGATYTRAACFA